MKSQMTHRERIMAAINHQPTDRVPTDYWGVPEITEKLMKHFSVGDELSLWKALDIDKIMGVWVPLKPNSGRGDMWNIEYKKVPVADGAGYYWEAAKHPLAEFETIEEIEASYEWPTLDMFDFSSIKEQCKRLKNEGYAIEGGYISLTYYYEIIRGTEQKFLDFATDEKLADYIIYKIQEFTSAFTRRILEEGDGMIDLSQITDDFGGQTGLMMSKEMIEKYCGKYYKENTEMVKSFGTKVFHHDDGAIMDVIPWVIEKGCQVLNPIQWHLPGWDLNKIKKEFGDKICFHGAIDNQEILPFGSVEDVKAEVKACMDALYFDRTGYILAPCHNLQVITPIENILAMYEFGKNYK